MRPAARAVFGGGGRRTFKRFLREDLLGSINQISILIKIKIHSYYYSYDLCRRITGVVFQVSVRQELSIYLDLSQHMVSSNESRDLKVKIIMANHEHLFLLALLCSTIQCALSGAWTEPSLRRASEDPQCTNIMQDIQYGAWTSDRSVCASPQPYLKTLCSQTPEKTSFVLSQMSASNIAPGLLWRPNNCSLKIFNGRSSRELLSRIGGFVVIGESVERHVAQVGIDQHPKPPRKLY